MRVDGTAGPCGSGGGSVGFVDEEVPSGAVDGSNVAFSISSAPSPVSSLHLFRNGLLQKVGFDYGMDKDTIVQNLVAGHQVVWERSVVLNP